MAKKKILLNGTIFIAILFAFFTFSTAIISSFNISEDSALRFITSEKGRGRYISILDEIWMYDENVEGVRFKITYHHELCHREQNNENRLNTKGIARFIDELECTMRMWSFLIDDKTEENLINCKVVVEENKELVDCEKFREKEGLNRTKKVRNR